MAALTLDEVRQESNGQVYPRESLAGCEDALVLFGAGFLGTYDSVWLHDEGLAGTVVDQDAEKLLAMEAMYPDWMFVREDAYAFAETAQKEALRWDVISIDGWTDQSDRNYDLLPLWCSLARRLVVLNVCRQTIDSHPSILSHASEGWDVVSLTPRTGAATSHWLVLEAA